MPDPILNQLAVSDIDNINVFDKRVWDTILPIQIIASDPILQSPLVTILNSSKLDDGGLLVTTAFTKRLSSTWKQAVPKQDIDVEGISQIQDNQVAISRYQSWGQEELAVDITGNDLLAEVQRASQQYWSDNYNKCIINMLTGIFNGTLKDSHRLNAVSHVMDWDVVSEATHLLGDIASQFKVILMHSRQLGNLEAQGLVKYWSADRLGYDVFVNGLLPSVKGMPIIVNDNLPTEKVGSETHYHAYIGAPGVIEFRLIKFNNKLHWNTLGAGTDIVLQTSRIMTHVPGVKFNLEIATNNTNPTDEDFRNPACWTKVAQRSKDIPLVEIITKASPISEL